MRVLNWRCATAAALAVLALGAQAASAAPTVGATKTDEAQVEAVMRSADVSRAQALRDLDVQTAAGRNIVTELLEATGDRFAGVWFDNTTGRFQVNVLTGDARARDAAAIDDVFAEHDIAGAVDLVPAEHTVEELKAQQDAWITQLRPLLDKQRARVALDPRTNSVRIEIPANAGASMRTDLLAQSATAGFATTVADVPADALSEVPADAAWCRFPYCSGELEGGTKIYGTVYEGVGTNCTAGFDAWNATYTQKYLITAGHCIQNNPATLTEPWYSQDKLGTRRAIGVRYNSKVDTTGDVGVLSVTNGYWTVYGWVENWGGNPERSLSSLSVGPLYPAGPDYVGLALCHEGASSGHTCGTVTAAGIAVPIAYPSGTITVRDLDRTDACGLGADSGAPYWTRDYGAHGILIAVNGTGCPRVGTTYMEAAKAANAMGVTITPEPGA